MAIKIDEKYQVVIDEIIPYAWALECKGEWDGTAWGLSWSRSGGAEYNRLQGDEHEEALYDEATVNALLEEVIKKVILYYKEKGE